MIVVNVFLTASRQINAVLDVLSPLFHVVITVSLSDVRLWSQKLCFFSVIFWPFHRKKKQNRDGVFEL